MAQLTIEFKDLLFVAIAGLVGISLFEMQKIKYKLSAVLGEDKVTVSTNASLDSLPPVDQSFFNQQSSQQLQQLQQLQQQNQQMQHQSQPSTEYYHNQQQQMQLEQQIDHEEEERRKRAADILARSGVHKLQIPAPEEANRDVNGVMTRPLEAGKDNTGMEMGSYIHMSKASRPFVFGNPKDD